jgi:hypothetical protein
MSAMLSLLARRFRSTRPWPVCSGSGNIGDPGNVGDLYYQASTTAWPSPSGELVLTGGGFHGGFKDGVPCIHRFIFDSEAHQYFGYDALLSSTECPEEYRLVFEPLSLKPERLMPVALRNERGWAITPLERLPSPRILRLKQRLKFDYATADGKHNLIERIRFTKHPRSTRRRRLAMALLSLDPTLLR